MNLRRWLAGLSLLVVGLPTFAHYYFTRVIASPVSTTSTVTGTPTAPVVTTQWRCITAAGATIPSGGPFPTKLAAETPCGTAVAADGVTRFLEESVVTTTNVPTTTTVRTRREEVLGGSTLKLSAAHAALINIWGGGGQAPQPGGGDEDWELPAGNFETAKIPLEIIAPQPSLNTQSPYYRWYPAIPFELPVVVLGGAWPFKYELVQAPSGMTIGETIDLYAFATDGLLGANEFYGVLQWSNPTTSGSPHTVEVLVTDQSGATDSVTWTLTVTTTGFKFVDAVGGSDAAAGTLAAPWQTWNAVYGSGINDATNDNDFVFWRAGDYRTDDAPISDGGRMFMRSMKPHVHIAYPGDSPEWSTENSYINWDGGNDIAVIGIDIVGLNNNGGAVCKSMQFGGNPRTLVYKSTFGGQLETCAGGSNTSNLFFAAGGTTQYSAIQRNTFDSQGLALAEGYDTLDKVIEGNVAINYTGSNLNGFYEKSNNHNVSVRANRGLTGNEGMLCVVDTYNDAGPIEYSWNLWKVTSGDNICEFGREAVNAIEVYVDRNTLISGTINMDDASGTVTHANNVRQHDGTDADGITHSGGTEATLVGLATDLEDSSGIVDANGLLTGAFRTNNLGTDGFELSAVAP